MEMRAPLLYYEHAGRFEEADGECAEDTAFRVGYASWSVCANNSAAPNRSGPDASTDEADEDGGSLRPGGLGETMSKFLMETSDR
jgi:hypothetical protein